MYFSSRVEAGQKLADELEVYKNKPTVIIALSDGGVVVAAQIAKKLRCLITMLLMEPIRLPGEPEAVAVINQEGNFTYNHMYSAGELEEFDMEYHHYIEQAKMEKLSEMHRLLGSGGLIKRELLVGHNIILVSDGLKSTFALDAVEDYLKPIKVERLIVATPIASVGAVDRMHILADEIHCLSVLENYMDTNHYFEDNTVPPHETIVSAIETMLHGWNPKLKQKL